MEVEKLLIWMRENECRLTVRSCPELSATDITVLCLPQQGGTTRCITRSVPDTNTAHAKYPPLTHTLERILKEITVTAN